MLCMLCLQVLTPYQTIRIIAKAQPYFPDYAQIVGWVVEDSAAAGEVEGHAERAGQCFVRPPPNPTPIK